MKNILCIVILIGILSLLFVGSTYYNATLHDTAFNEMMPFSSTLTKKLVENFFSTDEDLKSEAEKTIKKIVLKDFEYHNWIDYIDYIKLAIYPMDITNDLKEELVIALNLSKDEGIIGVYKLHNDSYVFQNKIEDLTSIKNITSIKNPVDNRIFIITEEILDESFGAFFIDNYLRVFTKIDDAYKEVFRQSTDYETYYYEKWTDPSIKNPKWFKLTEKSIIDYLITENGKVIIITSKNIAKYKSNTSDSDVIPENFELVMEKDFDITSIWNENYMYFLQGIGKIKSSNEVVGIIENSYQAADSLLNASDKYYKVIDKNGKIYYIIENDLDIINDYSQND